MTIGRDRAQGVPVIRGAAKYQDLMAREATGAVFSIRALQMLRVLDIETHLAET